jgi:hypothetical protein
MKVWKARQSKMAKEQRVTEKRNLSCRIAEEQRDLMVKASNEIERIDRKYICNKFKQKLRNIASCHFDNIITSKTLQLNYDVGCKMKQAGLDSLEGYLRTDRGESEIVAAMENNSYDLLLHSFLKGDNLSRVLAEIYSFRTSIDEAGGVRKNATDLTDNALYLIGRSEAESSSSKRFKRGRSEFSDSDD